MATVDVGLTCTACGHFNRAFILHAPVTERDIDRQGEKRPQPTECAECGASLAEVLLTPEGEEREGRPVPRRNGLAQTSLKRTGSTKPRSPEGPLTPSEWRRRVLDRQRPRPGKPALCAVTEEALDESIDEVHHPLEKSVLRAKGLHRHVWDERNGVAVKRRIHQGHTSRMRPIPREALDPRIWDFARELGPWATARIEEAHPVTEKV